jgi:hypothetical protein
MGAYILRRILLMIPTLFGIMAISFAVIQFAPGGPVEQVIAKLTGQGGDAADRISGSGGDLGGNTNFDPRAAKVRPSTAARRASIPSSSPSWKSSSASTSRRSSASSDAVELSASISARAISATSRCST